jgi:hypothetical protein
MASPESHYRVLREKAAVEKALQSGNEHVSAQALGRYLGNKLSVHRLTLLRDISAELDMLQVSDADAIDIFGALQLSMRLAGLAHAEREQGHRATDAKLGEAVDRLRQRVRDAGQPPEVAWYLIEHASAWLCAVPPAVTVPNPTPVAERIAEIRAWLPRKPAHA